jgi:sulfopropanediol 3-dehydrogenase
VGKFLKTCTYQRMTPQASLEVAEVTERQCLLENMLAHAITARVRIERYGSASNRNGGAKLDQERTSL